MSCANIHCISDLRESEGKPACYVLCMRINLHTYDYFMFDVEHNQVVLINQFYMQQ